MFWCLLLCFLVRVQGINNCLGNLEIVAISPTEASLSWTYSCAQQDLKKYKVHFTHQKFLACTDDRRDASRPSGIGTVEVADDTRVIIHNLHAFSEYQFEVVAVFSSSGKPEFLTVFGETAEGVPNVKAIKSPTEYYGYQDTSSKLVFDWGQPRVSQCKLYNCDLGSWVYRVQGVEEWNKQFIVEGNLNISRTKLEVDNLMPYSRYMLLLYTANRAGQYNENVVLKIPRTTKQSTPPPPSHLQATQLCPGAARLQWRIGHPPTGEVSHYLIRWKGGKDTAWMEQREVVKSGTVCDEDAKTSGDEGSDETACYVLNNLEENNNYSFQVQAHHSGVSPGSDWSPQSSLVILCSEEGGMVWYTSHVFIVLGCLPVLVTLVTIAIFKYRKKPSSAGKKLDYVPTDRQAEELLTPIIKTFSPGQSNTLPGHSSLVTGTPRSFTTLPLHRPRSRCDLPPLPTQSEHVYEAVKSKDTLAYGEDDYLAPNPLRVESVESLDDEGYLRPNFVPAARLK